MAVEPPRDSLRPMLPARLQSLWESYQQAEAAGIRSNALAALDAFLLALSQAPGLEWHDWAVAFAMESLEGGGGIPIRVPLFRQAIFPALHTGLLARQQHCARLLAAAAPLLRASPECGAQLPESLRWPDGLLRHALEIDPADTLAGSKLLESLGRQLGYALHELPSGVLYGANGATAEQCLELLETLREFEALASATGSVARFEPLLTEARFHLPAYREYLLSRSAGDTYAHWLETRGGA